MTSLLAFWTSQATGPYLPFWVVLAFLLGMSVASIRRTFLPKWVIGVAGVVAVLGTMAPPSRSTCGGELLFEVWLLCLIVAMVGAFRAYDQVARG